MKSRLNKNYIWVTPGGIRYCSLCNQHNNRFYVYAINNTIGIICARCASGPGDIRQELITQLTIEELHENIRN